MSYTVRSSERTRSSGAEYETKALLYLMNFRSDSNEIHYFVVDFFNDLTGMDRFAENLWDVQSKGAKNNSPAAIGKELVTLFKNYLSDIDFKEYILFLGGVSSTVRVDDTLDIFDWSNVNRTMESGELRCMDCNSTNISFSSSKKNAYAFDVSSIDMRNEIIASINEKIEAYNEEINKLASQISSAQDELQALMNDESISLESIVAYKQDVFNASDAEAKIKEIDLETESLKNQLKISAGTTQSKKEQQLAILMAILNEMNAVYEEIDPNGNLHFDDLFTKKDEVYSGSEATIFHLSRLYAFSKVLNHNYPIVVDSFRAEDLSTSKENTVLELYKGLSNQVIFTTTLKLEELGKYDSRTDLHHIDYKEHAPSKMLSETYVDEFCELLRSLSINL